MSMNYELLRFANLAASDNSQGYIDFFKYQELLVEEFRSRNWPFMASTTMRSLCECDMCSFLDSLTFLWFENPNIRLSQELALTDDLYSFGKPKGIFVEISNLDLHKILAHDQPMSAELKQVLLSVQP